MKMYNLFERHHRKFPPFDPLLSFHSHSLLSFPDLSLLSPHLSSLSFHPYLLFLIFSPLSFPISFFPTLSFHFLSSPSSPFIFFPVTPFLSLLSLSFLSSIYQFFTSPSSPPFSPPFSPILFFTILSYLHFTILSYLFFTILSSFLSYLFFTILSYLFFSNRFLEQQNIADLAIIPAREARERLYKLFKCVRYATLCIDKYY